MMKVKNDELISRRYLEFLFLYGPTYKKDYYRVIGTKNPTRDIQLLNERIFNEKGIKGIEEYIIPAQYSKKGRNGAKETRTLVYLTNAGMVFYKDHIPEIEHGQKPYNTIPYNHKQLNKIVYPHLNRNHAISMFDSVGIPVYKKSKPSLYFLAASMTPQIMKNVEPPYTGEYSDGGAPVRLHSRDALVSFRKISHLDTGLFYTKTELIEYLKLFGTNYVDMASTVNISGIFVSTKKIMLVFVQGQGSQKRIRLYNTALKDLLDKIKKTICCFTDADRDIGVYQVSGGNSKKSVPYHNSISALVIGNGVAHTYTESVGNVQGRIKKRDIAKSRITMKKNGKTNVAWDLLDCASFNFERIYSIDDSTDGLRQLKYITSHSLEDYHNDSKNIFKNYQGSIGKFEPSEDGLFPATFNNNGFFVQSIYMPVYDVKLMHQLHDHSLPKPKLNDKGEPEVDKNNKQVMESGKPIAIVTYPDMVETIAHCVRIEDMTFDGKKRPGITIFRANEDGQSIGYMYKPSTGDYTLYNHNGWSIGKRRIENKFNDRGYSMSDELEYIKFSQACSNIVELPEVEDISKRQEQTLFYNYIASITDDELDEIISKVAIHERQPKEKCECLYMPSNTDKTILIKLKKLTDADKTRSRRNTRQVNTYYSLDDRKEITNSAKTLKITKSGYTNSIYKWFMQQAQELADEQNISLVQAQEQLLQTQKKRRSKLTDKDLENL